MMHRITLVMTSDGYHDRRMMRIRDTLVQEGYSVSVIARFIPHLESEEEDSSISLIKTKSRSGPQMYYEFNQQAYAELCADSPELMYAVDLDTLWAVYRAHRKLGIPYVFDAHEFYTETPELSGKRLKKWIWSQVGKRGIRSSSARWTVTQNIALKLEEKYGQPFALVRNIPPIKKQDLSRPPMGDTLKLVYLGVINKGRGLEDLIKAISSRPSIHLDILGRGDIESRIKGLIQSLKIGDRCKMHGWVAENKHSSFLSQAHYGVNLLSADSESYRLSLANKFFDYVHNGLPALHMNYPEYAQLNEDHRVAVLVDELSETSIARSLDTIEGNTELYDELSRSCVVAQTEWNWENESGTLIHLIEEVFNQS